MTIKRWSSKAIAARDPNHRYVAEKDHLKEIQRLKMQFRHELTLIEKKFRQQVSTVRTILEDSGNDDVLAKLGVE